MAYSYKGNNLIYFLIFTSPILLSLGFDLHFSRENARQTSPNVCLSVNWHLLIVANKFSVSIRAKKHVALS